MAGTQGARGRWSEKNLLTGPTPRSRSRPLSCLVQTVGNHLENFIGRQMHVNFGKITLIIVLKLITEEEEIE